MAATYALLVGIDAYTGSVGALKGCVADATAMRALLEDRVPDVQVRTLVDQEATRHGVIDAFRTHLGRARAGDVAIFWYSGHGSIQPTSKALGVEPDGMDESLVLVDSRLPGGRDLADRELGALISGMAAAGAHVFVGLDCCHAGSGTREVLPDGALVRRTEAARTARAADDYLTTDAPPGRHVLLAACRSDQTAKEVPVAGQQRGALTVAFEQALHGAGATLTYRDLHRTIRAAVAQLTWDQVPQLEVTDDQDVDAAVLTGRLTARTSHYTLTYAGADWVLDAGAVHGIPPAGGGETTVLEIQQDGAAVATARVITVEPHRCVVAVSGVLDPARSYSAVVTAWPQPRSPVDVTGAEAVRPTLAASPYVRAAEPGEPAALTVQQTGQGFDVVDASRGPEPVTHIDTPANVAPALEQIARWHQICELTNPGSAFAAGAVRLDIQSSGQLVHERDRIVLPYADDGTDSARPQTFAGMITNLTDRVVYCAVLALGPQYSIDSAVEGSVARLSPHGQKTTYTIEAQVPDELFRRGVTRRHDTLLVIASTEPFDADSITQGGLPKPTELAPGNRDETRSIPSSTFDRLLRRVQQRELAIVLADEPLADWTTLRVDVVAEHTRPTVAVSGNTELLPGVVLQAPDGFGASATLTSTETVARDVPAPLVPPMLLDAPDAWLPYSFGSSRDTAAPLDVLELRDVAGVDQVTPEHPLVLRLPAPVAANESVLAFGWDGENYLPVGRLRRDTDSSTDTLYIESLPPAVDTRSLTGSIRLLFRRFVHRATGGPAYVTRLALASVTDGKVTYNDDPDGIRTAVAAARTVLLLVHGILGDTEGMVLGGLATSDDITGFAAGYDVVLSFDYENINTPVDETATDLLNKLRDAGVGAPDIERFDVIAHSMGGLVSRWLIEKLDDERIVDRLITAGTPNGGSPWPKVEDWAITLLTFGLNQLAHSFWPAKAVSWLLKAVEKVDTALDDMAPDSAKLRALFALPDPARPYLVLVGNRSLIVVPTEGGRVARILAGLKRRSLDGVTWLAFLREANDLAVSASSAAHLPAGRTPGPELHVVACDHVTFFSSTAGRGALRAAVEAIDAVAPAANAEPSSW